MRKRKKNIPFTATASSKKSTASFKLVYQYFPSTPAGSLMTSVGLVPEFSTTSVAKASFTPAVTSSAYLEQIVRLEQVNYSLWIASCFRSGMVLVDLWSIGMAE